MRYNAKDKSHNNKKYISTYITPRGGGTLFSSSTGLDPAFTVQPPPPPKKKKKKKKEEISGKSSSLKYLKF